jgi:hypothetical protein
VGSVTTYTGQVLGIEFEGENWTVWREFVGCL